jgi:hypothetical protein
MAWCLVKDRDNFTFYLLGFAAITLCVASQRVFIVVVVVVDFIIDSVHKLLDTPSHIALNGSLIFDDRSGHGLHEVTIPEFAWGDRRKS